MLKTTVFKCIGRIQFGQLFISKILYPAGTIRRAVYPFIMNDNNNAILCQMNIILYPVRAASMAFSKANIVFSGYLPLNPLCAKFFVIIFPSLLIKCKAKQTVPPDYLFRLSHSLKRYSYYYRFIITLLSPKCKDKHHFIAFSTMYDLLWKPHPHRQTGRPSHPFYPSADRPR